MNIEKYNQTIYNKNILIFPTDSPSVTLPPLETRKEGENMSLTCIVTDANPMETSKTWFAVDGSLLNGEMLQLTELSRFSSNDLPSAGAGQKYPYSNLNAQNSIPDGFTQL